MEESKNAVPIRLSWRHILAEVCLVLAGTGTMFGIFWLRQEQADILFRNVLFVLMGTAVVGFHARQEYLYEKFDYDNGQHYLRFWCCFTLGMIIAFVCGFLPVSGWPFTVVFVMLALFSNMGMGILAASVLLLISVLVSGAGVGVFALYFLSGVFAVTLFRHLEKDFKIGIPLFLSMLTLLLCVSTNAVLTANERPSPEQFVIPVSNVIISGILLLGGLKLFSTWVIYRHREQYLELNDTENAFLVELKTNSRKEYFQCIHTAYFCERIAKKLDLDVDALKCAGYYHKSGKALQTLLDEDRFPPKAREILVEYTKRKKAVEQKETVVLLCADAVVSSILFLFTQEKDKILDYDVIIEAVFKRLADAGTFNKSNITMKELCTMRQIFKEEKLYYDFLR